MKNETRAQNGALSNMSLLNECGVQPKANTEYTQAKRWIAGTLSNQILLHTWEVKIMKHPSSAIDKLSPLIW